MAIIRHFPNPQIFRTRKLTTQDMELALSGYFDCRTNLIVPNVSWGFGIHECDLLVLTPAGYAWEIEIKVSVSDLIADKSKGHNHEDKRIKRLYFAITQSMIDHIEHIPERAGIIVVRRPYHRGGRPVCRTIREPQENPNPYKFSWEERFKIARLGCLRIWPLKRKVRRKYRG